MTLGELFFYVPSKTVVTVDSLPPYPIWCLREILGDYLKTKVKVENDDGLKVTTENNFVMDDLKVYTRTRYHKADIECLAKHIRDIGLALADASEELAKEAIVDGMSKYTFTCKNTNQETGNVASLDFELKF